MFYKLFELLKRIIFPKNINTFASQRLVFERKIEPFLLENASNITYENLNKKSLVKFSCHTKTHLLNLIYFQVEMVHFSLKNEALRN